MGVLFKINKEDGSVKITVNDSIDLHLSKEAVGDFINAYQKETTQTAESLYSKYSLDYGKCNKCKANLERIVLNEFSFSELHCPNCGLVKPGI